MQYYILFHARAANIRFAALCALFGLTYPGKLPLKIVQINVPHAVGINSISVKVHVILEIC